MKVKGIEVVEAFKTSDGCLFEDEGEALRHQIEIDCGEWYLDNSLLSRSGNQVDYADLCEWLRRNSEEVLLILGGGE